MIAHLVLFRPKRELADDQREALTRSLTEALGGIPQIRRARLGVRIGERHYGQTGALWPFAVLLEFETEADLQGYLEHPTHADIAQRFFSALDAAIICDFEMAEATPVAGRRP